MEQGLTIYFVRHGETYFNLNKRTQGWCDPFLTPKGIDLIRKLGKGLCQIKFDGVIVSDLKRTQTTAELIIDESLYPSWTIPIKVMPEFREISFGSFEGAESMVTWQAVAKFLGFEDAATMLANTSEVERLSALHLADPTGQAESYQQYCQHINDGLTKLLAEFSQTKATLLFVGHSINIRYILQQLIPSDQQLPQFKDIYSMANGGVTVINNHKGFFELECYSDLAFIKDKKGNNQ